MTPYLADWWRAYVGGAYLWRGRTPQLWRRPCGPDVGVDCWGLHAHAMEHVFRRPIDDFGWAYPDDGKPGRAQASDRIEAELSVWRGVPWEEGAAALFRDLRGRPLHIGTCLRQRGIVLHAQSDFGVGLLDIPNSLKWKDRLVGTYLPG